MKHTRISVTDLDSYQYYLTSELSLDDFLRRLRRQDPPTEAMAAGIAWHNVLELAQEGQSIGKIDMDGFSFHVKATASISLPPIRELKGEKVYWFGDLGVTLVGVVDGMDGVTVIDHKLTGRPDMERFASSWQWKAYLEMFGGQRFDYYVYGYKTHESEPKFYEIASVDHLPLYRYPDMGSQVEGFLAELARFKVEHTPDLVHHYDGY